jgi:glycosyltransferase involved in cell wall biosynthesis
MRILYLVNKYPIEVEPKQGKYPVIMDGMLARNHEIVMFSYISLYRNNPWKFGKRLQVISKENNSLVIELSVVDFMVKVFSPLLRRFAKNKMLLSIYYRFAFLKASRYLEKLYSVRSIPDIIHVYGSQGEIGIKIALNLSEKFGKPVVWNIHSHEIYMMKKRGSLVSPSYKLYFEKITKFLPVSDTLGYEWEQMIGKKLVGNWESVPNPVDPKVFKCLEIKPSEVIRLVHVSTLSPNKNILGLLEVFERLADDYPVEFVIVGNDKLYDEAANFLKEMKHKSKIFLVGSKSRQEVSDILGESHIYVQASQFETFGIPVIEALFCGLPCIVTRAGGPEGLVPDFYCQIVDEFSINGFLEAIKKVIDSYQEIQPVRIRNYAIERYSPEVVFNQLERIYKESIS